MARVRVTARWKGKNRYKNQKNRRKQGSKATAKFSTLYAEG